MIELRTIRVYPSERNLGSNNAENFLLICLTNKNLLLNMKESSLEIFRRMNDCL